MSIGRTLAARPWIAALIILVLVAGWMFSGQSGKDNATSEPVAAHNTAEEQATLLTVQTQLQQAKSIMRYINVYGRSAPARTIDIKAETNGRVVAIGADRGRLDRKSVV